MLIANPIYDSVFKYLLEDTDLAREFLATILGEDIVSIEVKPQETTVELTSHSINVFRLDFKALIRTASGEYRKILIELQKAKHLFDIMRFRRYLADNYQKEDTIHLETGATKSSPLPIVTIYFLGFKLADGYPAAFKTNHQITDLFTGELLLTRPRESFVELLHHESYTIQIPLLPENSQTPLEKMLHLFSQEYRTEDPHKLVYLGDANDSLVKKMVNRLTRAIADEHLRKQMDVEDEVDRTLAKLLREAIQEKDAIIQAVIQEKDAAIQEKNAVIQEKDAVIQEKDALIEKVLEKSREESARKDLLIADLMKRLNDQ